MTLRFLVALIWSIVAPTISFAFIQCETPGNVPGDLSRYIGDTATRRTPVKYYSLVRSIEVISDDSGKTIIPFAANHKGKKVVVFPKAFAIAMCKIALATYLVIEGVQDSGFNQAAEIAAKCFTAGQPQKACLIGFGNELTRRYQTEFTKLDEKHQKTAFGIYQSALSQVAMHEYAHHFLDHFDRISSKTIARADAEFEADFFAVMNGVQDGDAASAMFYFFMGLAAIEHHTDKLVTKQYESGSCRANNIDNITGFIKTAPLLILDTSFGGDYVLKMNSPSLIQATAKEQFGGPPPTLKSETSCGKLEKVALGQAFEEMKLIYLRVALDSELLLSESDKFDFSRANRLLQDLSKISQGFLYMNGIAAKSLALMIRAWILKGHDLLPLAAQIDKLLAEPSITDNFLSEDYGRLLLAQGLITLQERVTLAVQVRLEQAFASLERAVFYNPAQSEGWMNLAFIAMMRGECAKAATFADRAFETADKDQEIYEAIGLIAKKWRQLSSNPEDCKAESADLHPYPGL